MHVSGTFGIVFLDIFIHFFYFHFTFFSLVIVCVTGKIV